MQAYDLQPLVAQPARPRRRRAALSPLDFLEPLLLLGVGFFALAPERFPPRTVLIALALLLTPYLLRWLFYGAPSRSTLADLPLALLFLVLTPLSLWVSPYFWENSWPEFVRLVWGGAVCLAVINWAQPLWGRLDRTPATAYRLPPRLWLLTFAYLALGLLLGLLGLLNMSIVTKIPWLDQAAAHFQSYKAMSDVALTAQFNPNRVAAVLVLLAPLPLAFLIGGGRTSPPTKGSPPPSIPQVEGGTASPPRPEGSQPPSGGGTGAASTKTALPPPVGEGRGGATSRQPRRGRSVVGLLGQTIGRLVSTLVWLALWLAVVSGLLLTQSRAGLVATALGVLVVLALTLRQPNGWLRLVGALFILLFVLGMSYSLLPQSLTTFLQSASPSTRQPETSRLLDTNSFQDRVIIWQRALNGLADQPLTGMGLAAFDRIAQEPYPLPGYKPGNFHHAHNLFLQMALDFGAPGLLVFTVLVVVAAWSLVSLYRAVPSGGQLSVWTVGLLGCFVAFVAYNCLDALTLGARPAVVLWFLLGLALSARNLAVAVTAPRSVRQAV